MMFSKRENAMKNNEQEAKERIIEATASLLEAGADPDKLTVRKIAEEAGVGTGLINYHFGSKENLLNEAVVSKMDVVAMEMLSAAASEDTDPKEALKKLLITTSQVAFEYPEFAKISIKHDLLQGRMDVASMLVPLVRRIFGRTKNETQVRLIALELITTLQLIFLRHDVFRIYSGYDVMEREQRAKMFDEYFDSVLNRVADDTGE